MGGCSFFTRIIAVGVLAFAGGVGCELYQRNVPGASTAPVLPGQSTSVFTTARPSFGAALNDFMDRRPDPVQPIEFPHNVHVGKQIACTEYCHESVTTGPVAGLPSVRTCMICHNAIATDRPRIQQITAMREKGIDLAWQRVYGYTAAGAREVQPRAAHPRQSRVLDLSRQHRAADGRAAQRRSEHGLLRDLPS